MIVSRRAALGTGLATGMLPRFAIAQADNRPTIRVAVQKISNTGTLEPLREQSSNVSERWVGSILETLIGRNQQGQLERIPGLATELQRLDQVTLDVDLRQGVRMHNGDELTAEDVLFTFGPGHMIGDSVPKDVQAVARRHFPTLARVQALSRYRVRFVTGKPDITLEGRISSGGGEIVSARSWQEGGSWTANSRTAVGSGPYRVVQFVPGSSLVLDSHDAYWGGRPPLKRIIFLEVPEAASRIAGLRAGDYDFACDLTPDQSIALGRDERLQVQGGLVPNHRIVVFDKNHPVLQNPKIRLAMAHAIDGQQIVSGLWANKARVPPGLQWEFYGPMFIDDWQVPEYDPLQARELILQSGYRGEEIIYRARHNYYTAEVSTAQVLVEFWRKAGLNVKLEILENWNQVLDRGGPRGLRDWSNSATFDDPVSSIVNQHGPNGAQQTNGEWTNEEMNALSVHMEASADLDARRADFARMLQICEREDPAYIVLHQNAVFTAHKRGLPWLPSPSFFLDFSSRGWKA